MKKKPLPPTLRNRKRYIGFRVYCDAKVSREDVIRAISGQVINFLGENLYSDTNLWVMDFDEASAEGFLSCSREEVNHIKACLSLISEINHNRACINILGISGTVKALKRKFLNEEFINEKGKVKVYNREVNIIRSTGDCIDAVPIDEDLTQRLNELKMKYIGLTKQDIA